MVADVLERWATKGWQWTHLPFGEHRNAITGARLKRMGTKRGWPDFILLPPLPDEHVPWARIAHFLELKRKGGLLTDEQFELMEWLTINGYEYKVCDNFDDAIYVLRNWGALKSTIHT